MKGKILLTAVAVCRDERVKNKNKRHTSDVLNLSMVYMCEAQNAVHVELKVRTV